MNYEFTLTLQDLETLFSKSGCGCHFINPNKTRLILWRDKDQPDTYYLRIGVQKFVSYPLKDKNKARYWRFNGYENLTENQKVVETSSKLDPITKFNHRQAQANGQSSSEQSVANPSAS